MTEGLILPQVFEQLKPELISPLVVFPGSEQCQDSGQLFEVGGWVGKVRWERSLGVGFDPREGLPRSRWRPTGGGSVISKARATRRTVFRRCSR
jgi:hypothetical protein